MIKVVVIGVESTGKSTLCQALAEHFNGAWVREYARDYLNAHGTDYVFEDLLHIAKGQVDLIEQATQAALQNQTPYLFVDTDMHVMHVWGTVVFGMTHEWIEQQRAVQTADLYLLTNPDLPWVDDGMREYPDHAYRQALHQTYVQLLTQQSTPWAHVMGEGDARVQSAVDAVLRQTMLSV
jgi:NadR type nicotinamide-nucleotide adenylyltransferase